MKKILILLIIFGLSNIMCEAQKTFKKTVQGSLIYSWFLPWDLDYMFIEKGTWDGFDHTNYKLYHGVDYICQRFVNGDSMDFEYCEDDDPLKAGAYLIQFAENYSGQSISVVLTNNVDKADSTEIKACDYYITGDAGGRLRIHKDPLYKFNTDTQRFEYYPEGKLIGAYEAYIVSNLDNPVEHIIPNGSTGIERLNASAIGNSSFNVQPYNLAGQAVNDSYQGIVIINGKKILR